MSRKLNLQQLFAEVRKTVPAYEKFLSEHESFVSLSGDDWAAVPIMDKKNYLHVYPLADLFPYRRLGSVGHASSGSSGKPTYWIRGRKQKSIGTALYGRLIRNGFCIDKSERTLVVVAFSMGIWIAGVYTLLAFEQIAENDGSLSVFSPGIEINDISSIISQIAPDFDNVVLTGYPGFIDILLEHFKKSLIPIPPKLFLLTSGDKSTEEWRDRTVAQLGLAGPESILNVYGSSDGGILGFESPLTIAIRRQAREDPLLRMALFKDSSCALPGLFQFDPAFIHFEEINGELVFSADLDLPLVRYNIHDAGRVMSMEAMKELVPELDLKLFQEWPFPFVTVVGRTDVAAVFFGLKIYPENILAGIGDLAISSLLSGNFLVFVNEAAGGHYERLNLDLELAPGQNSISADQHRLIFETIHRHLIFSNIEYRRLCSTLDNSITAPFIRFIEYGELNSSCLQETHRRSTAFFRQRGRKPQMIL